MKKLFFAGLFLSIFLLIACSDNDKRTTTVLPLSDIKKTAAISRAKEFMLSEGVSETNPEWGSTGIVTEAYPVYLDGVEDVSYYECKVVRNGQDAGYILVNVNETDVPFPQYRTEGKTTSEEFSEKSGYPIEQLKVYRNNWFEMFATSNNALRGEADKIVISRGMDENGSGEFVKGDNSFVRGKRDAFKQRVLSGDMVNPLYQKENLYNLHRQDSIEAQIYAENPQATRATTRWTSDELNNTFSTGWHLPKWNQVRNESGKYSGCGPLALAMVYAYHKQFKGKSAMFDGLDLNATCLTSPKFFTLSNKSSSDYVIASSESGSRNQIIADAVYKIGKDCGAHYENDKTWVMLNGLENHGNVYPDRYKYSFKLDIDKGGDFIKGKTALDEIRAERPCIVQFASKAGGIVDHYGAIEGVKYMEKKVLIWLNYEMWYLVNYGWGDKREWICVDAQYGSNAPERMNTGNLYIR
jgi:hypothetical protein